MVFKGYAFQLLIRIGALAITIAAFIYLLFLNEYLITAINIGLLAFFQIYLLYRYHNKFEQDLYYFFESIQNQDYSVHFTSGTGFGKLREQLNDVIAKFHKLSNEYEKRYQLYKYSLEQVQDGIIIIKHNSLQYNNTKALEIFNLGGSPGDKHRFDDILKKNNHFAEYVNNTTGGQSGMVKINTNNEELTHSVKRSKFSIEDVDHEIFIIVPIQNDLDLHEVEIWQRLISVLTHEDYEQLITCNITHGKIANVFQRFRRAKRKRVDSNK